MSSARAVGLKPAAERSAEESAPSERRLWRSILRRWPNAACVTLSRSSRSHGSGSGRGGRCKSEDCHLRRWHKGGRIYVRKNPRFAAPLDKYRKPPVALRARRATMRSATSRWNMRIAASYQGGHGSTLSQDTSRAVAMLYGRLATMRDRAGDRGRARIDCEGIGRNDLKAPGIVARRFRAAPRSPLVALDRDHPVRAERKQARSR